MSEYLRHTADHVSWLIRQKRREIATTRQLAARINQILQRRGVDKGLTGVLGADEIRRAVGIVRPAHVEEPEVAAAEAEPEAPEIGEPQPVEAAVEEAPAEGAEAVVEEAPPEPLEEPAEAEPEAPELGEPQPVEPAVEEAPAEGAEAAVEEAPPELIEEPAAGIAAEVELDIKEAAAEAAAVEGIPAGFVEEETATEAPADGGGLLEELVPHEEAADLADVVAEIQGVGPEQQEPGPEPAPAAVAGAPAVASADDEVPFEAALEPRALIPRRVTFSSSADEVLFNRAIERLGTGEVRGVREAIDMLGHVRGDTAAGALMNLYQVAPRRWRLEVAHRLVRHSGAGIAGFFCRVLDEKHEPPVVRVAALRGLFTRDKALAADYLLRAVGDPSDEVRAAAATYLGWLREQRAVPLLEHLLNDASRHVAKAALHAASAIRS